MTTYPLVKDTSSTFLVTDGVTPIDSELFRRFSTAILAIENELGVNPSGTYSDLRQRMDIIEGVTSGGGSLPIATIHQHLEYSGTSWDAVDNMTFPENPGDNISITIATPITTATHLKVETPITTGSINSGNLYIQTGNAGSSGGYAGSIKIYTGNSYDTDSPYNSNNGIRYNGAIDIVAGIQAAASCYAGSVNIQAGTSTGLNSIGGDIFLRPGSANTQQTLGKLLICAAELYGQPTFTNKYYPIYVKTANVDGYYPGIRYNNTSNIWEFKNDGYTENQWLPIGTNTSSNYSHNLLSGLQGGNTTSSQYYHLTSDSYVWLNDIFNLGYLNIVKGGTGITSYTSGDILYSSATNTLSKLPKSTDGYYLQLVGGLPSWSSISSSVSSQSSIIDIKWGTSVADGYLVYTDKYSSSPQLKIANLANANNYLYSNVLGIAYSQTDKVITNGVYTIYCETSAVPGDVLYLSPNNNGMATNTLPVVSNNCIVIIGKCFSEKASGIGTCSAFLDIKEPILLE